MSRAIFSFLSIFLCLTPAFAQTQITSFDAYLQKVNSQSPILKAINLDIESLRFEIAARDVELSTTFGANLTRFWDDRPTLSSNNETKGQAADFTLAKPFASGTSIKLTSALETADYRVTPEEQNLINWQFGISQSLWQNSFGRQTSLRRKRDQSELQSRLLILLLEKQQLIIDFELRYWDLAYAQKEVEIRQENFERSKKIFTWIEDRFKRYAAEKVDYLQAQVLMSSRDLQLQVASDKLKTLKSQLCAQLSPATVVIPDENDLSKDRVIQNLSVKLDFAPPDPILIATLQSQASADYLKMQSKLQADQLKPVLEVGYAYGQQGLNSSFATARRDAFSADRDYHQVGITFLMPLDFSLIKKSRLATEYSAKAQESRTEQLQNQSVISWEDLQRTVTEQKERIITAQTLAKLQTEKSNEERSRYEKGKSTAFEAISFEQDAAESQLLTLQLISQLRRTEAQARNYTQNSGLSK